MKRIEPEIHLVAETVFDVKAARKYLNESVGSWNWAIDDVSGSEILPEMFGRLCYRSFEPGLNKNVTKVREGNEEYLANIINVGHGSVLEHGSVSFIFHNVSRVFTHEIVRHRAGCAMSQESLRYVRLDELGLWIPEDIEEEYPEAAELGEEIFKYLESKQKRFAKIFDLDNPNMKFAKKKYFTSFMRRFAPIGLATSIGFTMNHRALRHILVMRTSRHAEVEMRKVFSEVGKICFLKWPHLFTDFDTEKVDGYWEYTTPNNKI